MSSGGALDFLVELNAVDSLSALNAAQSEHSNFIFNVNGKAVTFSILNFLDKRAILNITPVDLPLNSSENYSIKFTVGTEVYFIKTTIKSHLNKYYFDINTKVIQLKRRKEPRYVVPIKWKQSAAVHTKTQEFKCVVLDISLSGAKLEITQTSPVYNQEDIIKLKFQIHKRGEIQCAAIVRFSLIRPKQNQIIGIEFASDLSVVNQERVASIIEDIKGSISGLK